LLPNQTQYLDAMRDWYLANQLGEYGLPLNSRKLYTKDDWATFLAATFYTPGPAPQPSALSSALFDALYRWANATTDRDPLSDWTNTDAPTAAGFLARPVYGAMWAPLLVTEGPALGLGRSDDPAVARANAAFARVHEAMFKNKS
jgi:hypothetical protein